MEVSSCLSLRGLTPFTTDKEMVLKGQIQAVASPNDAIRRIVGMFGGRQAARLCLRWAGGRQATRKKPRRV